MKPSALMVDRIAAAYVMSSRDHVVFDNAASVKDIAAVVIGTPEHLDLARALARRAVPTIPVVLVAPPEVAGPAPEEGVVVIDPTALPAEAISETVERGIEARKRVFQDCVFIAPFVPPSVDGEPWQAHPTERIAHNSRFFSFEDTATWHGFTGYGESLQMLDPCKLLLVTHRTTPCPDRASIRIPTNVIATFLREHGVIPEKSDLYSMVFLLTPGTTAEKLDRLVDLLIAFEAHVRANTALSSVLPSLHAANPNLYAGGLCDLCARLDDLYATHAVPQLLKCMFEHQHLPTPVVSVQEAHRRLVKGEIEAVPLHDAEGRIAAEGALPYPPGIFCIAPGERWGGPVLAYFKAVEAILNTAPGFAPWYHGVTTDIDETGARRLRVPVIVET